MITRDDAIQVLRLFSLKADRLERSKFRAWMVDPHREGGYSMNRIKGGGWHVQWGWPEDEDVVDAYLLTIRMFVQARDCISVQRLPGLYRVIGVQPELLDKLTFARKTWLGYLRQNSTLISRLASGDKHYTNGQVLELLLFGDRAHLDMGLRERFESWYSNAGSRAILETKIIDILDFLHVGISVLRDLHREILAGEWGDIDRPDTPRRMRPACPQISHVGGL